MPPVVTLLSDFGARDEFAGVLEGVVLREAPDARVIHLTHGIEPQAVLLGALALANALPFTPVGVHLAVVDPGVGSDRRAIVLRTVDGRLLVGPDNGLLVPAAERVGGLDAGWAITDERLFLHPVSRTFHGRDVFAPVVGRLAAGLDPVAVGPPIALDSVERVVIPEPEIGADGAVTALVLAVDRFGNAALNVDVAALEDLGMTAGERIEIAAGDGRYFAERATTFADVGPGEMVVYADSSGWAALAVNHGSIAEILGLNRGDRVRLERR